MFISKKNPHSNLGSSQNLVAKSYTADNNLDMNHSNQRSSIQAIESKIKIL